MKRVSILVAIALALSGCRGGISDSPPIHLVHDMDNQPKLKPQSRSDFTPWKDHRGMRTPVFGTVARGSLREANLPLLSRTRPKIRAGTNDLIHTEPTTQGRKYPANRSFRAAITNLRFGSGTRFELANQARSTWVHWEVKFIFGTSKDIRSVRLYDDLWRNLQAQVFFTELDDSVGVGSDPLSGPGVSVG